MTFHLKDNLLEYSFLTYGADFTKVMSQGEVRKAYETLIILNISLVEQLV
jgi:hypothetical protein